MSNKLILIIGIILIILAYLFNVDRIIRNNLSTLKDSVTDVYISGLLNINSSFNKYFNQSNYIDQLKLQNEENQKYKILYEIAQNKLDEKEKLPKVYSTKNIILEEVNVLSYKNYQDSSIVVLNRKMKEDSSIEGLLTYDGYSAGIILKEENQNIAYLNQHRKSNYAVFIGKEQAPGITSGVNSAGDLLIKYVPLWKNVKIDDEVITSGMDTIFPFGIKVGKVLSIKVGENTKQIEVRPYGTTLGVRNFLVYKNLK